MTKEDVEGEGTVVGCVFVDPQMTSSELNDLYHRVSIPVNELFEIVISDRSISHTHRGAIEDAQSLFKSGFRNDILSVLIPTIRRLRSRIEDKDVRFFAGADFVPRVAKAAEERCTELVRSGQLVHTVVKDIQHTVIPLLEVFRDFARRKDDLSAIEAIFARLQSILGIVG